MNPYPLQIKAKKIEVGQDVILDQGVSIIGEDVRIGRGTVIKGPGRLLANKIDVGSHTVIHSNFDMFVADDFVLGDGVLIEKNVEVSCRNVRIGRSTFIARNVIIGGGGETEPEANLVIGEECLIAMNVILNVNKPISIGDNSAIGPGSQLWTHGRWLPVLDGYNAIFGKISIGSHVWVTGNCTINPNVKIHDGSVIGANSLVGSDIPPNAFAIGSPARVIQTVGKGLSLEKKTTLVQSILKDYESLLSDKGFVINHSCCNEQIYHIGFKSGERILFAPVVIQAHQSYFYSLKSTVIMFLETEVDLVKDISPSVVCWDLVKRQEWGNPFLLSEDLRNYLRRRGIKITTDRPFQAITPVSFRKLLELESQLTESE